jgi:membrane protein involved in colicin uptake
MKKFSVLFALVLAGAAYADDKATITFSGKGHSGVEIRDASGKVTEVRGTKDLRVNQIPAEAVAREEAQRQKDKERGSELAAKKAEEEAKAAEEQKAADEAAAAQAQAAADEAAAADKAAKAEAAHHPMKIRGKTVRGTRYVANPTPEPEHLPAPAGPVLSAVGDQPKEEPPADAEDKTEKP